MQKQGDRWVASGIKIGRVRSNAPKSTGNRLGRTNHADLTRSLFYPTEQGTHCDRTNSQPLGASPPTTTRRRQWPSSESPPGPGGLVCRDPCFVRIADPLSPTASAVLRASPPFAGGPIEPRRVDPDRRFFSGASPAARRRAAARAYRATAIARRRSLPAHRTCARPPHHVRVANPDSCPPLEGRR
jgi:hypothetical protein